MPAIKIENLSKRYIIGHQKRERYTALRDVMMHKLRAVGQRLMHPLSPNREIVDVEEFWALQDINLEIQQGDRVGIIGRNGAGKSTLLKVLSRITEPTKGRITVNGRVASLLEVGTGFHPELSGRENIFLNGAILGMRRSEIKRKFDEIVDFSGTEKFLDTPVKRYSSGMYVRLAFAVAAHLEPEILVVDEVLAVGDAEFQKKCLGKMGEVARDGRTILFVSHNMAAIKNLCSTAVWLGNGSIRMSGKMSSVVESYFDETFKLDTGSQMSEMIAALPDDPAVRFIDIRVTQNGENRHTILPDVKFNIEVEYQINLPVTGFRVFFDILDDDRSILIRGINDENCVEPIHYQPGRYLSRVTIPANLLAPRSYEVCVQGTIYGVRFCTGNGVTFSLNVAEVEQANKAFGREKCVAKVKPILDWENISIVTAVP